MTGLRQPPSGPSPWVLGLVFCAILAGCASRPETAPYCDPAATGTAEVLVFDEQSGLPVAGAAVELAALQPSTSLRRVITDQNGYATLDCVPFGAVVVTTSASGYQATAFSTSGAELGKHLIRVPMLAAPGDRPIVDVGDEPPNPSLQRTTHGRSPVCGR